jgi:replicative DNA helicase
MRNGFISKQDWGSLTAAGGTLHEAPIYIDDYADNSTLAIRTKSRRLKKEKGLGMVIIDYLQLMKVLKAADRRDLDIAEISRSLKSLCQGTGGTGYSAFPAEQTT